VPPRGESATSQVDPGDVGSQIVAYAKQGRFDEAVQVGQRAIQNHPDDDFVYQQIANVYLMRAKSDTVERETWVIKAVSYLDKALSIRSNEEDVAGVHRFQIARSLELAGDLSPAGRCSYYDRAQKLLRDRVLSLQGDNLKLEGKTFPLIPLRAENESAIGRLQTKTTSAACR
jgi:tetratricopeptide (TPR) repeat protein